MSKVILVCGAGPGISKSVAQVFGKQGYKVALASRSGNIDIAEELKASGVDAKAFTCDLADVAAIKLTVGAVREAFGSITTLHYNDSIQAGSGNLLDCDPSDLGRALASAVGGLVAAVQACLDDLRVSKGAVLVTGGGFGLDATLELVAKLNTSGVALQKAAQHKATMVLHHKLKDEGIYVGTVVVAGLVSNGDRTMGKSDSDLADATGKIGPGYIADKFWELHEARSPEMTVVAP